MKMRKVKRCLILSAVLALVTLILMPALVACNEAEGSETRGSNELHVYNWEDYIDPGDSESGRNSMVEDFERYYESVTGERIKVVYTTFDTNETMMTKVLKDDAQNVDLICPSEYAIEKLLTAGKLANQKELYEELKPTLEAKDIQLDGMSSLGKGYGLIEPDVMDVITNMFSSVTASDGKTYDMTEYMVPYMWGTLGILYNKAIISQEELDKYGWGVLWNLEENEELENMILMKDSVRDTYAAALFYMYEYDLLPQKYYAQISGAQDLINITDDEVLALAEEVLTEQRDHISGYEVDFGKDDMLNEIVYADFAWSGDALWAVEESYDEETDDYSLAYYCPTGVNPTTGRERFSNIWYDGWVIPKTVKNKLAAMMFIDFMCRPENAIRNSIEIGYTCAAAKEALQGSDDVLAYIEEQEYDIDEYFDDIGRYPEINNSLGVMRDFGGKNEALVNMWQRAKSGSGVDNSLWIVLAVLVGGIGIALAIYFIVQALKLKPRKIKTPQ